MSDAKPVLLELLKRKRNTLMMCRKSTSYDGASLRSPILEKGVMLGVPLP